MAIVPRRFLHQKTPAAVILAMCILILMAFNTSLYHITSSAESKQDIVQLEAATDVTITSPVLSQAVAQKKLYSDGEYPRTVLLQGLVFDGSTKMETAQPKEFPSKITTSVVSVCNWLYVGGQVQWYLF